MDPSDLRRAGFWRRLTAFLFDVLLIVVALEMTGVWLAGVTGGKVRVSSTLVTVADCTTGGPRQLSFSFPSP
jgi:hypothetical protein